MELTSLNIREIQPSDDAVLAKVIRDTLTEFGANHPNTVFTDPTTDALFDLFRMPGSVYYVAEEGKRILGGGGIYPSKGLDTDTCELVKMYLVPDARGFGLGKQMIEMALAYAKNHGYAHVYIETMPELKKAMGIYERFGFRYIKGPLGNTGHCGCSVWMLKDL